VHPLNYKSYANLFYTKTQPATDSNYRSMGYDKNGKKTQPEANEKWLLHGNVDKPTYFICKIQDSAKYTLMPQLTVTGSKNGFVFLKRK
jgi:hypothetical protein